MARRWLGNGESGNGSRDMNESSEITERAASRNDMPVFDAPATLEEALLEDLHDARKTHRGINEVIGIMCGVAALTVYSWRRGNHEWTPRQIVAVVQATGGKHTRTFLDQVAAASPVVGSGISGLAKSAAIAVERVARLNRQVVGAIEDGKLDAGEAIHLRAYVNAAQGELAVMRSALES